MFIFVAIVLLAGEILGRPSITSELQYKAFTDFEAEFLSMEGNVTLTPESINGTSKNSTGSRQERGLSDIAKYAMDAASTIHPNTILDFFGGLKNLFGSTKSFLQKGSHEPTDMENTEKVIKIYDAYNTEQIREEEVRSGKTLDVIAEKSREEAFQLYKVEESVSRMKNYVIFLLILTSFLLFVLSIMATIILITLKKIIRVKTNRLQNRQGRV